MFRIVGFLIKRGLQAIVIGSLILALFLTTFSTFYRGGQPAGGSAIVVLAGGVYRNGNIGSASARRATLGIDLFLNSQAKLILFTGGDHVPPHPSYTDQVSAMALERGVPTEAVLLEPAAQSTAQNAIFSLRMLADRQASPVTVVSDCVHLPRVWATFYWAGAREFRLNCADGFGDEPLGVRASTITREVLAWWANAIRLPFYSVVIATGLDKPEMIWLLD